MAVSNKAIVFGYVREQNKLIPVDVILLILDFFNPHSVFRFTGQNLRDMLSPSLTKGTKTIIKITPELTIKIKISVKSKGHQRNTAKNKL